MKTSHLLRSLLIASAIAAALPAIAPAYGQSADRFADRKREREERRQQRQGNQQAQAALFPDATRDEPRAQATSRFARQLDAIQKHIEEDEFDAAVEAADALAADTRANDYERAFAQQAAASALLSKGDYAAAQPYLQRAIDSDALPNDTHYQLMYQLAQLQMQDENYAQSLATIDRLIAETRTTDADYLITRGNVLYRLERYPEAIEVLQAATSGAESPNSGAIQLLMAAYAETGQTQQAVALAEQLHQANPEDNRLLFNLAAVYSQADQVDQAAALLDQARQSGRLTTANEYRQLYALFANMEGQEAKVVEVIQDGLAKGILTENAEVYTALGQSYYYSDQVGQAIDAYLKAGPLAETGESYLNAAKLLAQEDRWNEAVEAANQARAKGVRNPADIDQIIQAASSRR
ncbi:tetratricopeptide repeat protein [Coralloluteibacterium thermophilus]|uniref:Tetratricopeptide repeat protein n=1 Tax=Coralloluteibacterium thermophilum TaxID=2707049 RepID=A0ABV9NNE5_9GAMM